MLVAPVHASSTCTCVISSKTTVLLHLFNHLRLLRPRAGGSLGGSKQTGWQRSVNALFLLDCSRDLQFVICNLQLEC